MTTQSIAAICGRVRHISGKALGIAFGLFALLYALTPASAAVVTYTLTTDPPGLVNFVFGVIPGPTGTVTLDNGVVEATDLTVNAYSYGTYSFSGLPGVQEANPQPGCLPGFPCNPIYVDFALDVVGGGNRTLDVDETFSWGVLPNDPSGGGIINWGGVGVLTSSAPEPSSWMLAFVGIGFLGAVLRWRRFPYAERD